jgi:hypothetical protein
MKRLEVLRKLTKLETKREQLVGLIEDLENYYCKRAGISVAIETTAYERHYEGEHFDIDKKIFVKYLQEEMSWIDDEITCLINELKPSANGAKRSEPENDDYFD